jgi:hypothetical protein
MASMDKKRIMRKRGRKVIKYLEVIKWVMENILQYR